MYVNKNKGTRAMCNNMVEPHKDNVEWKNPGTKEDILYNSIYVKLKKTGKNKQRLRDVQLGIKVKKNQFL